MGPLVQIWRIARSRCFALAQARALTPTARAYLVLNVAGASILAVDAFVEQQWGFLLLESVWALIAASGLARDVVQRR